MMCTHVLATPYLSSLSLSLSKDTHYSIQCFELNYKNHLLCMRKPHSLIHARAHLFFFPKKFILHQLKCHYVHTFSPFIGQSLPTSIWATSLIYLTYHLHSITHMFVLYVSHVIHAPLYSNGRGEQPSGYYVVEEILVCSWNEAGPRGPGPEGLNVYQRKQESI